MKKRNAKKKHSTNSWRDVIPILHVKKGASRKEIYAAAHRAFTAADLQKFTEIEEGVPAQQVAAELEAIYREAALKQKNMK